MNKEHYNPQVKRCSIFVCLMFLVAASSNYIIVKSFKLFWFAYSLMSLSFILAFLFYVKLTSLLEMSKRRIQ